MRVLREAPKEWRSHSPVDRDAGRPLDAELFGTLDRLRARVNAWHERNTADKQALIARAQQLATATDTSRAIDEAKRLQAQWQATGPVPHAQSQAMWRSSADCATPCSSAASRSTRSNPRNSSSRRRPRPKHCASRSNRLARRARRTDRPAKRSCASGRTRRRARRAAAQRVTQSARSLPARDVQVRLADRRTRAARRRSCRGQRRCRRPTRARIPARRHPERCRPGNRPKAATEAFIAGVPRWPGKGILQALRQSLARAESPGFTGIDDTSREQALRRLCIHAEILSGATTAAGDIALRRDQEMQMLRQGLGQARQADDRTWEAMRLEWLGLDAAEPAVHDELERRFMKCLRQRWW